MAQQALGRGATKRRAMFGLLDRDGWAWASLKAFGWFIFIILILGYIPDRAYYFTVFSTIPIGIRADALTPVNFCPASNQTLPCPAPEGAFLPWQVSPKELALPAGRRDGTAVQVGTHLLYIGGTDGTTATSTVYEADLYPTGNFSAWRQGPALPAPRTRVAAGFFGGSVLVIGGADASGAPTTTAYYITPDAKTGALGQWQVADGGTAADGTTKRPNLTLPAPRDGTAFIAASDGVFLVGGRDATGPTTTVWKSTVDTKGNLGTWQTNAPLVAPRADGTAILTGPTIFVYGGVDAKGPTAVVQRGDLGSGTQAGSVVRWGTPTNAGANLPAPRTDAAGFTANGSLYLVGGTDGTTPRNEAWWTTPDSNGAIAGWSELSQMDLPAGGLAGSSAVASGSNAYLIGGATADGVTAASVRTNLAPMPPFFQLGGPFGATIPALKIDGEIGQQLGYLAAAGVATANFVLLILIGWALAHQDQTRALIRRIRARRGHAGG
ncbi:MAG: Kelch repeat-containing protein [Candidatus Limnocylindrales bacterium]